MLTRCLPARRLRAVRNPAELPVRLQQVVWRIGKASAWRAYSDDSQWWFAVSTAEQNAGGCTLKAAFFSEDGVLCGAGSWRFRCDTGFELSGIFETHTSADQTPAALEHAV